ncbi:MAG: hypothetical protein IPN71_18435 [Fibrobacteres bacterium]|nr:hypothetical protein [Fibrobacterota bacterium]
MESNGQWQLPPASGARALHPQGKRQRTEAGDSHGPGPGGTAGDPAELEPLVEPRFHPSSYGYRPNKDAHQALAACVLNCKSMVYVTDLDISGFFDTIDHEKMMDVLGKRTDKRHVLMYCRRWLQAQVWKQDGTMADRDMGTPQGGVISPLLANIFLDEVFDRWMAVTYPDVPFERYADDIVVHAVSEREAKELRDRIRQRLGDYGLGVNEEKTRVVYCWRAGRPQRSRDELHRSSTSWASRSSLV